LIVFSPDSFFHSFCPENLSKNQDYGAGKDGKSCRGQAKSGGQACRNDRKTGADLSSFETITHSILYGLFRKEG